MATETRCIATAGDANYYPGVISLLKSLEKTNPNIPVVVFDGGFTKGQTRSIERYARLIKAEPFTEIKGRGKFSYIGQTTLLKFEVAELETDKVLFLDADMVVRDSLEALFDIPEGMVGVVRENTAVKNIFRIKDRELMIGSLNIDWNDTVFNGGIFILRPAEWRGLKGEAKGIVDRFGPDVFSKTKDHQILNLIFSGKTYAFPGRYNFSPLYDEESINDPAIIHYLEERKPWHLRYPSGCRYSEFRENLSVRDWPGILLVDVWRALRGAS